MNFLWRYLINDDIDLTDMFILTDLLRVKDFIINYKYVLLVIIAFFGFVVVICGAI